MASWQHATIGVVPSVWPEPFGQVAVECQSVGTPVIVSATGGLTDIVTTDVSGLVVAPGDAPALAAAIDRLAADPDLRTRLGETGRLQAREFTMTALLPQLEKVYVQAQVHRLAHHPRRRSA
jgi:glycosyltransferase involved in cell wall biosynthesis